MLRTTLFVALLAIPLLLTHTALAQKSAPELQVQALVKGLQAPWAMAQLPDGDWLVTERPGRLRRVSNGKLSEPIKGVPEVFYRGQGGLLDVTVHPQFADNRWVYLSFSEGVANANSLRVIRAKLVNDQLTEVKRIFTLEPRKDTPVHFGGRIAFLPDNSLLITTGDGFDYREQAQVLDNQMGKILRFTEDGEIPADNPFVDNPEANPAVYSLGHRNPQALLYDGVLDKVFSHEHGPAGGDELNIIAPGNNYGWPVITEGKDYSGAVISPFKEYPGMQQPWVDWTPSIAPSGMILYRGAMFPEFNGDLLVTTLKYQEVRWVQLDGDNVSGQQSLLKNQHGRLRDIAEAADGAIMLLTDAGELLRVSR